MKRLITLIVLMVLSASLAVAASSPFGVWEWIQTETAPGVFVTALENGNSMQRSFHEDMTFNEYQDESPVLDGTYWVQDIIIEGSVFTVLSMDFGGVSPARSPYVVNENGMLEIYWGVDSSSGLPSYPIEYFAARSPISVESGTWDRFKALFR